MTFQEHIDDDVWTIQANLDDMNPEIYAYVMDRLFETGAYDVYLIPIIMKKGRPGVILNVLTSKANIGEVESIVFTETTSLGLRYWQTTCHRLAREVKFIETPWGMVNVKVGYYEGKCVQFAPEYEDCQKLAKESRVALKVIYDFVRQQIDLL